MTSNHLASRRPSGLEHGRVNRHPRWRMSVPSTEQGTDPFSRLSANARTCSSAKFRSLELVQARTDDETLTVCGDVC